MRVMQIPLAYDAVTRSDDPLQSLAVFSAMAAVYPPLVDDGGRMGRTFGGGDYGFNADGFAVTKMTPYGQDKGNTGAASAGLLLVGKDATTLLKGLRHLAKGEGNSDKYKVSVTNDAGLAMYAGRWSDSSAPTRVGGAMRMVGHNVKQYAVRTFLATLARINNLVTRDTIARALMRGKMNSLGIAMGLDHYSTVESLVAAVGRDGRLLGKCAVIYICPSQAMPPHTRWSGGTVEPQMQSHLTLSEIASKASVLFHK